MPSVLRTVLLSVVCIGCGFGCSDPQDPAKVPKAAAATDVLSQAPSNTQLEGKPPAPMPSGDAAPGVVASVEIKPRTGNGSRDNEVNGVIQFAPTSSGMELSGALRNLPEGAHGLHIHQNDDCASPGEHFAPTGKRHGDPGGAEHHLGDLGNVEADASNQAVVSIGVSGLALNGTNSILGHAMVVHAGPDDMTSQPSGNSGDVIGCGIITAEGDADVRPENREKASN